jgi:branched-chain amino acid transport system permease protein
MAYWSLILTMWGVFALLAVALNLLVGEMGLFSLCHAAFFGCGAYTVAILIVKVGVDPVLASCLAPLVTAMIALLLGSFLYRLKGDFFAMATFGAALVFYAIILNFTNLTGGAFGLVVPLPTITGELQASPSMLWVGPVWLVVLLVALIARRLKSSPLGRVLNTMREDEVLAVSLGKKVRRHRLVSFVLTAGMSGAAGVVYVWLFGVVDPSGFGAMESVMLVAMVVVGGAGRNRGVILGAGIVVLLPELLRAVGVQGPAAANLRQIVFGIILYLVLVFRPQGLLGRLRVGEEARA